VPPKGAPNVLLIITDDAGFGVPSTFGGVIPTDRRQLTPEDIQKLEGAKSASADGPVSEDLSLVQKLEGRLEKRQECSQKADAQKLGPIQRIIFMRECL
jgi:arylsulfatase